MINMNVIDKFLDGYLENSTIKGYRSGLNIYFKIIKVNPNEYIKQKRDFEADILKFWKSQQHLAGKTITNRLTAIRQFLEENNIDLSPKFWKKLKRRSKPNKSITIDRVPTPLELRRILQHGDPMIRAITLIASSSGMRIGEILKLNPDDIDYNSKPTKINLRAEITKTKTSRITFISNESTEALQEWLKIKKEWFRVAIAKSGNICEKNPNDKRLFPINHSSYTKKWHRCLRLTRLNQRDKNSNIHVLHIHTLRKYFETRMSFAGVPEAIYQELEGHEGYLNGSYKRYTEEELKEAYLKGLPNLLVFETLPLEHNERITKIEEKDKEIEELRKTQEELTKQMEEMRYDFMFRKELNFGGELYKRLSLDKMKLIQQKMKELKNKGKSIDKTEIPELKDENVIMGKGIPLAIYEKTGQKYNDKKYMKGWKELYD
jgi:integrase